MRRYDHKIYFIFSLNVPSSEAYPPIVRHALLTPYPHHPDMSELPPMAWLPWSLTPTDSCVLSASLGNYVSREEQQREREASSPH